MEGAWEGRWKRVITSMGLCYGPEGQHDLLYAMRILEAYEAEHLVVVGIATVAATLSTLFTGGAQVEERRANAVFAWRT